MSSTTRIFILLLMIASIGAVLFVKSDDRQNVNQVGAQTSKEDADVNANKQDNKKLPKLLELGSEQCVPCKVMKEVLAELSVAYPGQFEIEQINVLEDEAAAKAYHVRFIPVLVFLDEDGNELYRHEGIMPKEDVIAKWGELGVELKKK